MRLWVFRIVTAIALPVLVLISIEAGLRLFNVGYRSEFTVPCTMQGQGAYCDNDYFTWQFFPPGLFRLPPAFAMKAEKQKGTFRIFIVGTVNVDGSGCTSRRCSADTMKKVRLATIGPVTVPVTRL